MINFVVYGNDSFNFCLKVVKDTCPPSSGPEIRIGETSCKLSISHSSARIITKDMNSLKRI